ncbi:hypothetical protein BVG16_16315 [Paenibacillus selenitireducens]|uniref:IraD/Gp25-like domain-containing protein n=1 Tax=Paenibacillus selenitireducens TaxID=1324314 RepID=A0A1T2XA01_9BACL|nr:GPW/gp25 family protein [Paenibacillus selenitireducens]OPA76734.1 hypothetical protein BVG16_16315 [Paenibacillus selenitireducens]
MIVNFSPKSIDEEIHQNVVCIIETVAGSVPLNRSFGLDSTDTDLPVNILQAQMTNRIISALQDLEPRIVVEAVTYQPGEDGKVNPNVKYKIAEGVTF